LKICSKSDIGLVRSSNQDAYYFQLFSEDSGFVVVCDGMGGENGGDIASSLAVETAKSELTRDFTDIEKFLFEVIKKSNLKIFELSQRNSKLHGMGTTIVLAFVSGDKMHLIHVGDSRAYLIRDDFIQKLTRDHSLVQDLIDSKKITEKEAENHVQKNVLTRALGVRKNVNADYSCLLLKEGDKILICTDGLSGLVKQDEILGVFLNNNNNTRISEELIKLAKNAGGNDNITVVIIDK